MRSLGSNETLLTCRMYVEMKNRLDGQEHVCSTVLTEVIATTFNTW
jgi:hypothetical protein